MVAGSVALLLAHIGKRSLVVLKDSNWKEVAMRIKQQLINMLVVVGIPFLDSIRAIGASVTAGALLA